MPQTSWTRTDSERKEFNNQFDRLVDKYIETYNGPQPIFTWSSESGLPHINTHFIQHLPEEIKIQVKELITSLMP
jgi:hypothetical protein